MDTRLFQRNGSPRKRGSPTHAITGSITIHFIHPSDKPTNRSATYLRIVCVKKPHKEEKFRVRFTGGGNRINYQGVITTSTAELHTVKIAPE